MERLSVTPGASTAEGLASGRPGCIFVLGMHRSGTSATAEVLGQLGLSLPSADDLIPATGTNAHGHFEAKSLVRLNERLLAALGGTWSAPPPLASGWEKAASLEDLRIEAPRAFAAAFPRQPAAWKDPRNCIVLPFWRTVLPLPSAAVFVYRDPLEVARSLQSRDDLPLTLGLALWERYARAASANLQGLPTLCTDYRAVLDDPGGWCQQAVEFLVGAGFPVESSPSQRAAAAVDRTLRHQHQASDHRPGLGDSQRTVLETLRSLDGPHLPWTSPDLGTEPGWVGDVLAMGLEVDLLEKSYHRLTASRAYRLASVTRYRGQQT